MQFLVEIMIRFCHVAEVKQKAKNDCTPFEMHSGSEQSISIHLWYSYLVPNFISSIALISDGQKLYQPSFCQLIGYRNHLRSARCFEWNLQSARFPRRQFTYSCTHQDGRRKHSHTHHDPQIWNTQITPNAIEFLLLVEAPNPSALVPNLVSTYLPDWFLYVSVTPRDRFRRSALAKNACKGRIILTRWQRRQHRQATRIHFQT